MNYVADLLLASSAFSAAIYCLVLAKRLKSFSTLETGMGGAIAVLSAQVDDMTRALDRANLTASASANALEAQVKRAEAASSMLELMIASLHDLPETAANPAQDNALKVIRRRAERSITRNSK